MCMIDSAEHNSFYNETWRRARKEHLCEECRRTIAPGENYLRIAIGTDGSASSYSHCIHCHAAASWLVKHCDGFLFGSVEDDLFEHWGEHYDGDRLFLGRAIVGLRRKWRRRDGTLMQPMPVLSEVPTVDLREELVKQGFTESGQRAPQAGE